MYSKFLSGEKRIAIVHLEPCVAGTEQVLVAGVITGDGDVKGLARCFKHYYFKLEGTH